jgi:methyl halide transferase
MSTILNSEKENDYWSKRYETALTGWDLGVPSLPLQTYVNQLINKDLRILIPGAGNAYEAEYLWNAGFKNIVVLDISDIPLKNIKARMPDFPDNQLIHGNFFEHIGQYDLVLEQTFFCSFPPTKTHRELYAKTMSNLLITNGKLVGLWFDIPLVEGNMEKRPFGGTKSEYLGYLSPYFGVKTFETCHNSIKPRAGQELFGIFQKKEDPSV